MDVSIIRTSSGSVRQRIQKLGRVLRRGDDPDSQATLYDLFARDIVDENIFRNYDWEEQLGNADLALWNWQTGDSILEGEIAEIGEELAQFEELEFPDAEAPSIGDPYEGHRRGYRIA